MKKINLLIIAILVLTTFTKAQTANKASANTITELNHYQKGFLTTTWYESPKESNGNALVFKRVEYVVIVGLDDYNFPPSKLFINNNKTFNSEYMKTGKKADPKQNQAGSWIVKGNVLTLTENNIEVNYTIVSLDENKMVLSTN